MIGHFVFKDCNDDGEAQAGRRLLHLLQIVDVTNVLVVVSRWLVYHVSLYSNSYMQKRISNMLVYVYLNHINNTTYTLNFSSCNLCHSWVYLSHFCMYIAGWPCSWTDKQDNIRSPYSIL